MNENRLYRVLVGPISTEKSLIVADKYRQIVFKVAKDATKNEIKYAVEKLFNVMVKAVNTINVKGKVKKFKQRLGKRSDVKKALVTLQKGYDINTAEFS
jgi:large subunit ribosomal protein L23